MHDVREAQKERDEMRRERDMLLQEKLSTAVELEVAKCDSERWKAAVRWKFSLNWHHEPVY